MKYPLTAVTLLFLSSVMTASAQELPYLDSRLTVGERVNDLLGRMTLEEKIGQMCQYVGLEHIRQAEQLRRSRRPDASDDAIGFYPDLRPAQIEQQIKDGLVGSFLHVVTAEEANHLQKLAGQSRLGIPLIIGIDAIHGTALVRGATVYPVPIGLASSFDADLVERVAVQTAKEMRATGSHWTFSPNLDVARDARWGRVGETFGEDPLLVGRLGAAMVRGYQGQDLSNPQNVLACAKHLIAGSQPINGLNASPTDVSRRTLLEIFIPPYVESVREGVTTVMMAHNEINGVPCHASRDLMESLLRKELGFNGFVVSDWMDIERLATLHRVAANQKEAVYQTVSAGMDMHMHGPDFLKPLADLVREGRIPEERIDDSARRILDAKFRLGLFENSLVSEAEAGEILFQPGHQDLALESARKSIVLLKNDGHLPIDTGKVRRIFVTGPNAASHAILGDWVLPQPDNRVITVVEGLRQIAPAGVNIEHLDTGSSIKQMDPEKIRQAAARAAVADLAVVVVGENSLRYENQEKTSGENVDRSDIGLAGRQLDLIQAVHLSGTPTVVVLVNSRPLELEWVADNVAGLIEAWEPGSKGGQAVAEILFGTVNPSGKLPISFPRQVGQIQTIYNHKPSQYFHKYVIGETGPRFEFGFGLSYSRFQYSNLLVPDQIDQNQGVTISVDVLNDGDRAGDEIVLVFVNDRVSSVTTPVRELKGFRRISLEAGQSQTVRFQIDYQQLALYDSQLRRVVEPGQFEVFVGPLQAEFEVLR